MTPEERRARRDERRAKQRGANLGRAEAMHRARLAYEAEGRLPIAASPPVVNVGCSGWFYWHWRGSFYPPDSTPAAWFAHYAAQFCTVELNAPFYGWPTLSTVRSWLRQCEGRPFVYTVKVSELITHVMRFEATGRLVRDFGLIADLLGPHMGCLLYQLPPSFHYAPERLQAIVGQLDRRRRNVVESAIPAGGATRSTTPSGMPGSSSATAALPGFPTPLPGRRTSSTSAFTARTAGTSNAYAVGELKAWAERVRESGPERVWAYFNNHREAHAVRSALVFRNLVEDF